MAEKVGIENSLSVSPAYRVGSATTVRLCAVVTASARRFQIPAGWAGKWVRVLSDQDVKMLFGDSSVVVDKSVAASNTGEGASAAGLGQTVKGNVPEQYLIPAGVTHVSLQGASADCTVELVLSSP